MDSRTFSTAAVFVIPWTETPLTVISASSSVSGSEEVSSAEVSVPSVLEQLRTPTATQRIRIMIPISIRRIFAASGPWRRRLPRLLFEDVPRPLPRFLAFWTARIRSALLCPGGAAAPVSRRPCPALGAFSCSPGRSVSVQIAHFFTPSKAPDAFGALFSLHVRIMRVLV